MKKVLNILREAVVIAFFCVVLCVWLITWPVCWIGAKAEGILRFDD